MKTNLSTMENNNNILKKYIEIVNFQSKNKKLKWVF